MKKILNLIILFTFINTYIILPFNQLNPELELLINNNDITNIITSNSILNLYTAIYLGNTPFKLLVKITPYNNHFSFLPVPKINFNLTKFTLYNPFLSKSLHRNKNINFKEEFREVTDVFYFLTNEDDISNIYMNDNNLKIDEDKYKPYLYLNCFVSNWHFSDNYTGTFGLGRFSDNYPQANFIKELKAKSVINNSIWSMEFNDNDKNTTIEYDKGYLVIGEYPHIYNPNKYKSENLYNIKLVNDNTDWIIKVDNSYIIKQGEVRTSSNYIKYINIIFGLYTMQAPYCLYEQLTSLFFQKYFENKTCQSQHLYKDNIRKTYITCSKKYFDINQIKSFPTIIFYLKKQNNTDNIIQFELNYKDVFSTKNDKVYFLINFSPNDRQDMIKVGQIFLSKYKMVFDYESAALGLYISNQINKPENKEIIICIFLFMVLAFFVYFGYKKGYCYKKKNKSRKIK